MLPDKDKPKEQLVSELALLRQRNTELATSEIKRKQAEEALGETRDYLNSLLQHANAPIIVWDADQRITIFNVAFERLTGYMAGEVVGQPLDILFPEASRDESLARIRQTLSGAYWESVEIPILRKDGEIRIALWNSANIYDKDGSTLLATIVQGQDITKQKQAEEKILQQNVFLNNILESLTYPFYVIDVNDYTIKMANPAANLGNLSEKLTCHALTHQSSKPCGGIEHVCPLEELKKTKKPATAEHIHYDEDGNTKNIEIYGYPIFDTEGNVIQMIEYCFDITERKQAEEELQKEKETAQRYLDVVGVILVVITADGKISLINRKGCEVLGYQEEEIIGKSWFDNFLPEGVRDEVKSVFGKLVAGEVEPVEYFENSVLTKSGEERLIAWHNTVLTGETGNIVGTLSSGEDVTERKQVEEALRESEERYRALVNLGAEVGEAVTMSHDTEQGEAIHIFVNDEWPRITGYSREELLGMSFFDLVHPEHREASLKRHRSKMSGEAIPGLFEVTIIRKDGTEVPIELTGAHTTYHGKPANVAYMRDITERKQAEEREKELQQELSLARRLAAVGELAAGVAHEINNPLTGVLGFSERLLRKSTDEEIRLDLERIHSEAQRIVKVMGNLRTFARRYEPEKQYSDINDILHETLELRAYELKTGNIEVVTNFARSLPEIEVDSHQIQEVFLNIILNAEQVMSEAHGRGKLTIKTQKIKDYVRISFTDDGPGIPAEHMNKLFDPFFTTRGEKGGTGLGLSVCHGIVTGHGGRLYTKSKPGEGATFFVELPCREQG